MATKDKKIELIENNKIIIDLINKLDEEVKNQEILIDEAVKLKLLPNTSPLGGFQKEVKNNLPTGTNLIRNNNGKMKQIIRSLLQIIDEQKTDIHNI